jgi:hypothetical protein
MSNLELLQCILVHHHWRLGKTVSIFRWETWSYSNVLSYIITDVSGNLLFLSSDEKLGFTPVYRTSSLTFRETCFYLQMSNLELLQYILVHHHRRFGKPVSILRWETWSYSSISSCIITDVSGKLFLSWDEKLVVTPVCPRTSSLTFRETCFYLQMSTLELLQCILVHHHRRFGKPVSILRWETCSYSNKSSYIITDVSGNLFLSWDEKLVVTPICPRTSSLTFRETCFYLEMRNL